MKYTLILCSLYLLIGVSCKKEQEETIAKSVWLTQKTWVHDNEMLDLNNNLKPDDVQGVKKDIIFNFDIDGTLDYSKDQIVKQLQWKFENNETVIRIIGIMDDAVIPPVEESMHEVYLLDESTLILFYASTTSNPEFGTFDIYKNN